jgi:hypothetical protein
MIEENPLRRQKHLELHGKRIITLNGNYPKPQLLYGRARSGHHAIEAVLSTAVAIVSNLIRVVVIST